MRWITWGAKCDCCLEWAGDKVKENLAVEKLTSQVKESPMVEKLTSQMKETTEIAQVTCKCLNIRCSAQRCENIPVGFEMITPLDLRWDDLRGGLNVIVVWNEQGTKWRKVLWWRSWLRKWRKPQKTPKLPVSVTLYNDHSFQIIIPFNWEAQARWVELKCDGLLWLNRGKGEGKSHRWETDHPNEGIYRNCSRCL